MYRLHYFKKIAETNTMTEAARDLHVSQPTLSRSLQDLEKEIGVELFDRKGRNIMLNEYGKVFLDYVNRSLGEYEKGLQCVREMSGIQEIKISIAATFPHMVSQLIVDYLEDHPEVHLKQFQATSDQIKELLEDQQIDFAISPYPLENSRINWVKLADDDIFLTVSQKHPLSQYNEIPVQNLSEHHFIGLPKGYGFRDWTDSLCLEAGIDPQYQVELEDANAILKLVEKNVGVSFTPGLSLNSAIPDVHVLKIKQASFSRPLGIAFRKDQELTAHSQAFLDYTVAYLKKHASRED